MLADEDERVVLSRGDTCLRGADVALLRGPHWLNDHLITFFFTHLTETHASDDVLLVDGSVRTPQAVCLFRACTPPHADPCAHRSLSSWLTVRRKTPRS